MILEKGMAMHCKYCFKETKIWVDQSGRIFPCCKECKEEQNGPVDEKTGKRKMKLFTHMVVK